MLSSWVWDELSKTVRVPYQSGKVLFVNAPIAGEDGITFSERKTANVKIRQEMYPVRQRLPAIRADDFILPPQVFQPAPGCRRNAGNVQRLDGNLMIRQKIGHLFLVPFELGHELAENYRR